MSNALVPEFAVTNCRKSIQFYCDVLGFTVRYDRPEDGFAYIALEEAELMLDQIGKGRDFDAEHLPKNYPFGRGINFQILAPDLNSMIDALEYAGVSLFLPVEERWYRKHDHEIGNRQFVVADPDGYLLRFYEDIGSRPLQHE